MVRISCWGWVKFGVPAVIHELWPMWRKNCYDSLPALCNCFFLRRTGFCCWLWFSHFPEEYCVQYTRWGLKIACRGCTERASLCTLVLPVQLDLESWRPGKCYKLCCYLPSHFCTCCRAFLNTGLYRFWVSIIVLLWLVPCQFYVHSRLHFISWGQLPTNHFRACNLNREHGAYIAKIHYWMVYKFK